MADLKVAAAQATSQVEEAAGPWLTRLARLGYAAKGVVYVLIGWIAVRTAWQGGGGARDSRGAISTLLDQPFGRIMLGIVAVGLFGYTLWRAYTAVANPERDKTGKRLFHGWIALIHAGLTITAAGMALSGERSSTTGNEQAVSWTARLMEQPMGRWLVMGAAAAFGIYGLWQFRRSAKAKLDRQLDFSRLGARHRDWVERTCRFGIAARGAVFLIIAWFLVQASLQHQPGEARGLGGAMNSLRDEPYGRWLLTAAGLGMASYGLYQLVRARYRVLRTR